MLSATLVATFSAAILLKETLGDRYEATKPIINAIGAATLNVRAHPNAVIPPAIALNTLFFISVSDLAATAAIPAPIRVAPAIIGKLKGAETTAQAKVASQSKQLQKRRLQLRFLCFCCF